LKRICASSWTLTKESLWEDIFAENNVNTIFNGFLNMKWVIAG